MKYILVYTDGYSIDYVDDYQKLEEVQKEMKRQYKDCMPSDGISPEWEEVSYLDACDAMLYANGEAVHVWKIIAV